MAKFQSCERGLMKVQFQDPSSTRVEATYQSSRVVQRPDVRLAVGWIEEHLSREQECDCKEENQQVRSRPSLDARSKQQVRRTHSSRSSRHTSRLLAASTPGCRRVKRKIRQYQVRDDWRGRGRGRLTLWVYIEILAASAQEAQTSRRLSSRTISASVGVNVGVDHRGHAAVVPKRRVGVRQY